MVTLSMSMQRAATREAHATQLPTEGKDKARAFTLTPPVSGSLAPSCPNPGVDLMLLWGNALRAQDNLIVHDTSGGGMPLTFLRSR